jgi:hypothetical protein
MAMPNQKVASMQLAEAGFGISVVLASVTVHQGALNV